jgi:hypothetical protein
VIVVLPALALAQVPGLPACADEWPSVTACPTNPSLDCVCVYEAQVFNCFVSACMAQSDVLSAYDALSSACGFSVEATTGTGPTTTSSVVETAATTTAAGASVTGSSSTTAATGTNSSSTATTSANSGANTAGTNAGATGTASASTGTAAAKSAAKSNGIHVSVLVMLALASLGAVLV